jgi:putative peptide zinc metalloprotease protein
MDLLLGLKVRGVLLRPRAAGAAGQALAWLHYPVLAATVLAGFAAFEAWLFAGHGAIGPLLSVLRQPVLLLAVAGLTLASLLFHEFGHASACRYGGARPGTIGFGLYLVWPSLYTDVTDVYRLGRSGRLRTDLGGVYFNAIFILVLGGCYAATGQPVFLAAAFLDNFQVLQQLAPLVRMDGYFILGDLAGVPDLLGLVVPIMASLLPGFAARRAASRAAGLRRGPRILVSAWVLVAIPLMAAAAAYTLWNLPTIATTAARSFAGGLTAAWAGFSAGHPAAGLAALLNAIVLVIPVAGVAYLLARIAIQGARAVRRLLGWRQAGRGQRFAVMLSALCAMAAGASATLALTVAPGGASGTIASQAASADRARAAAWIAGQVSPDVTVACDPQMCGQVHGRGVPAAG